MEYALIMQIIIVTVYWLIVHENVMLDLKSRNITDPIFLYTTTQIHVFPFLAVAINSIFSKFSFNYAHYKYVIYIGSIYAVFNYAGT